MKENFERFISCKSTIDDIHVRLRKAEGDYGDGASGASTADMVAAVTDVGSLNSCTECGDTPSPCGGSGNVIAVQHVIWLYKPVLICAASVG